MQILMPIYNVDSKNVFFSEKRKNVILDGNFVKIIYSTEHFEMTGLQILLRLQSLQRRNDMSGLPDVPGLNDASLCKRRADDLINREFFKDLRSSENANSFEQSSPEYFAVNSQRESLKETHMKMESDGRSKFDIFGRENGTAVKLNLPAHFENFAKYRHEARGVTREDLISERASSEVKMVSSRSPVAQEVKFIETFDPYSAANARQIELLCNIEHDIVNNYIQLHAPQKNAVYNLKSQLTSRTVRFSCATPGNHLSPNEHYLLKISGIWETNMNVGITVKFVRL